MSRFTHSNSVVPIAQADSDIVLSDADMAVEISNALPELGEAYLELKLGGSINELALLAHWQDGLERLIEDLPALQENSRSQAALTSRFTRLWRGVVPELVTPSNASRAAGRIYELAGPCQEQSALLGVSETLAMQRIAVVNVALRIAEVQTNVVPLADVSWSAVERGCLKALSAASVGLGTAPAIENVLGNPRHPLFERVLSMAKEIGLHTQRLEGRSATDPDLPPEQQRTVTLRSSLVARMAHSFIARQHLDNSGAILNCMSQFGSDALPAFEYMLSGTELSRDSFAKVMSYTSALSAFRDPARIALP